MKHFSWSFVKNQQLITERKVSFEEVVYYIERGLILDIVEHPSQEKYAMQRIFIIDINDYAYLVPYVESKEEAFLKTIIPSRKATKMYLRRD